MSERSQTDGQLSIVQTSFSVDQAHGTWLAPVTSPPGEMGPAVCMPTSPPSPREEEHGVQDGGRLSPTGLVLPERDLGLVSSLSCL